MDKLIWINIIIICFCFQRTFAQKDSLNPYMISYESKIIVSGSYQTDTDSFFLNQEVDGEIETMNFFPNIKRKLSFGITYKLIDISIGYTPWFMKSDASKYKASNFNFGFRFHHKKWYQSISIVKQKGFFTELKTKDGIYLPAFRSIKAGGTTSYVFNDKFSFSALFNQNQWQVKSAGSFVPNFAYYYTSLENKDDKASFNLETHSLSISPSYYYTWVLNRKVFLSGGLGVGAGIDIHNKKTSALGQVIFNSKLGYNTDSFYSYLEINNTNFLFNENKTRVDDSSLNGLIAVGFRFDPPKKISNLYNKEMREIKREVKKEMGI